ncbi:MAG TPA: glycosyltransferase family 2 protein [Bryobacteraceae bacterium]|nr:glycosyltransferase family 2 protein [Bryobacteraceae bacterium]
MSQSVCVTLVTFNARRYIEPCLESILRQTYSPLEIVVVDNGSLDGTRGVLAGYEDIVRVTYNNSNIGFAAAQNQAIARSSSDWVLVLNPDVVLAPDFIEHLMAGTSMDPRVGTICGRLLSIGRDLKPLRKPLIDSAGLYFTPAMRHFDRGWHEPDDGRFRQMEYVFGASAAAALYRREMIADISDGGHFFDPDFFAYREDADVSWRAQLLGWRCLYIPSAVGHHVRTVNPLNRHEVPAVLNMHSVKNRFLLRIKNMTSGLYRKFWAPTTGRDLLVLGGCLLREPKSLPAFWRLARCCHRSLKWRHNIMSRRQVSDENLAHWFSSQPSAQPVDQVALEVGATVSLCNR